MIVYSKSSMSDPHIQKILQSYSEEKGLPLSSVEGLVQEEADRRLNSTKGAKRLAGTTDDNIIESIVFDDFLTRTLEDSLPQFDEEMFDTLMKGVKYENISYFSLTNPFQQKPVKSSVFLVPDSKYPEYDRIKTAACSDKAELIFNVNFMQNLVSMGELKGIKGVGKKYVSNGGNIPDSYSYIEFLIIHEFSHYVYADHFYGEKFVKKHCKGKPGSCKETTRRLLNYVGDFIINHNLLKIGHPQLPMGLFSEEINFDKQKSYEEIIEIVEEELSKLESPEDAMNNFDKQMDDHMEGDPADEGDGEPSDGSGSGEPSDGSGSGEPSDGSGSGEPGDEGDGEPSDGSGSGEPGDEGDGDFTSNMDKAKGKMDDEADEVKNRGEEYTEDKANEEKRDQKNKKLADDEADKDLVTKLGDLGNSGNEGNIGAIKEVTPSKNWVYLFKKMLSSGKSKKDTSYSKVNARRASIAARTLATTGSSAISPGEIILDSETKSILFIIDDSGSVASSIKQIYQEIYSLLLKNKKNFDRLILLKFSQTVRIYEIDLKSKETKRIEGNDIKKDGSKIVLNLVSPEKKEGLLKTFTSGQAGGTDLDNRVLNIVKTLKKSNFNFILISDSDILSGENLSTFKKLLVEMTHKNSAILFPKLSDYNMAVNLVGARNNISVMDWV